MKIMARLANVLLNQPIACKLTKNKVGQRTQKQDGTQHDFFENLVVCALHEIDVRSLLKHRAR